MAELTDEQKKIASLEDQVKSLSADKTSLADQIKTLTTEKQAQAKQIEQLLTEKQKSTSDLDQAAKVVTQLKEQLAEKLAGTVKLPTVSAGKDTYELVGGAFTYNQSEVTLETLQNDPKLVAELVKEKVGNLRKL